MSEIKTDATNLIPISWEILDQNLGQFLTILPGLGDEGPTTDIQGISIFIQPVNNDNLYEDQITALQSNFEYKLMWSGPSAWQDMLMYTFVGIDGNGQNININISKEDIVNGDVLLQVMDNDYQDLYIQNSKAQEKKEEERKEGGREEGRKEGRRKLKGGKKKRRRKTKKKKRKRRRNTIKKIRLNIQKCKKCSKCYDNVVLHYKKCVKKCQKKKTRRRRKH